MPFVSESGLNTCGVADSGSNFPDFTTAPADEAIWQRDVYNLWKIRVNTIRLYGLDFTVDHTAFFDAMLAAVRESFAQFSGLLP